jgi:hypothetical protein
VAFGMEKAEELTRPPDRETAGLPSFGEPT